MNIAGVYESLGGAAGRIAVTVLLAEVQAEAPDSAPILVVSWVAILVTSTVYGAVPGFLAAGVGRLLPGSGSRSGVGAQDDSRRAAAGGHASTREERS